MKSTPPRAGSHARSSVPIAVALCLTVAPRAQSQGKITFDGPPVQLPGTGSLVTYHSESGIAFLPLAPAASFGRNGGGDARDPYNGSAYLQMPFTTALTFNSLSGVPFGLVSVDLAEYSTVAPQARTVSFIGHKADGSTVTISFTADGIIDGTGPLADFETFYFDSSFTSLTQVDVPGYGWSMDNLVYSIPEPSAFSLLAVGALFLARKKFQRQRSTPSPP